MKYHLKRIVGDAHLTYEELYTVLTSVEAILNSRPLLPLSDDPNENSLTPGHFLVGDTLTRVPEPDLLDLPYNRLSRWQRSQQLTQHFWRRWSREYLHSLQVRNKWRSATPNFKVGDMVLILGENQPPMKWLLGRITTVHPGNDGLVRVVTVKTASSELKRPSPNYVC